MSKILLIEDDATMRMLLKALLEIEGHQVILVTDPSSEDIVQLTYRNQPDLLILDVYLKNLNGIEIMRSVKEKSPNSKIKILMTSGMDHQDECLQAGADGFLLKPFMPDELISKLNRTLNG